MATHQGTKTNLLLHQTLNTGPQCNKQRPQQASNTPSWHYVTRTGGLALLSMRHFDALCRRGLSKGGATINQTQNLLLTFLEFRAPRCRGSSALLHRAGHSQRSAVAYCQHLRGNRRGSLSSSHHNISRCRLYVFSQRPNKQINGISHVSLSDGETFWEMRR